MAAGRKNYVFSSSQSPFLKEGETRNEVTIGGETYGFPSYRGVSEANDDAGIAQW